MKLGILFLLLCAAPSFVYSQENEFIPSGKPFATIHLNFHKGISSASSDDVAFELTRAYLGYEYNINREFYAKINVDVGSPSDLSPYSKARRYAYFKNAFLRYTKNQLKVDFGLIDTKQFKLQEDIWERRYMMESFSDQYGIGHSADLGMSVNYVFSEQLMADFIITNGEGYSTIQLDDVFKYGIGPVYRFKNGLISKVFFELSSKQITETTWSFFLSYDHQKKWNIAGEYVFRKNDSWKENHNINGYSFYGKYNFAKNYQLFARYDIFHSIIVGDEINPWNLAKDGTALVGGIQFTPVKNIKMSVNYQDWFPRATNMNYSGYVYLNLEVKI
jgi:hypothetical protein